MADFCLQCAKEMGLPDSDGKGLCKEGEMVVFLCEGCGFTQVDHTGACIHHGDGDSLACFEKGRA